MNISLLTIISVLALVFSLGGNLFINLKNKMGFVVWAISNVLWIAVNLMGEPNVPQIAMFVVYTGFNIHGLISWSKKGK